MKLTRHTGFASDLKPGHWMIPRGEQHPRVISTVQLVVDGSHLGNTLVKFDFYKGIKNHMYRDHEKVTYYKVKL